MTFWRFFTTRYTDHLEQENRELKSQLAIERQEVRRLTEALVPGLRRQDELRQTIRGAGYVGPVSAALHGVKPAHKIIKAFDDSSASCTCGWEFASDDPVELQTAISEHYKLSFPPVKAKRPSPSERIRAEEEKSFQESQSKRTQ